MIQFPSPGFQVGDRVFTLDGREGVITASQFSDDGGFWEYLIPPVFVFVPEFELSRDDTEPPRPPDDPPPTIIIPPPEEEEELVGFVSQEELRGLVLAIIQSRGGLGVSQADLDAAIDAGVERSNLIAQGNLLTHVDVAHDDLAQLEATRAAAFQDLESLVTTTLSEIEKRATDLEAESQRTGGIGFLGFVGGLGGLLRNPVDWIMTRLGDHISSEVNDGLNS